MKKAVVFLLIFLLSLTGSISFSQHMSGKMRGINKRDVIMPGMTLNFNLLNIALYGPIIQVEAKLAGRSYLVPYVRYSYFGLISNYQFTKFDDSSRFDPFSIAVGIGYKKFLTLVNRKHFAYYGAFGEFIHEQGFHNLDAENEYKQTRQALAVYGNFGYRWNFNGSFYMNLGILPGLAFDIKNEGVYNTGTNEGLLSGDYKKNRFIGMIDFSFGWNIKRGY